MMGFSVCFLFPSGITWLTSNTTHMTSRQVSVVFMGNTIGNSVFPPLASKLFNDLGPIYVFYMNMILMAALIICFGIMQKTAQL